MKKILVTGASGQLGQCLKDEFSNNPQEGFQVIFLNKEQLDVSRKELVETFFFSNKIDFCINCVGYTNIDLAETEAEQAFKVNSDAVRYLAEECCEQNATLIQISTANVFDGKKNEPYKTDDPTNPINVYGKSKLEGERWALGLNPKTIVIRTAWLYSELGENFYVKMLRLMNDCDELNVVSDQIGKPTNARDLAKYILELIQSNDSDYGIRNFSGNEIMSRFGFAKKIATENGFKTKINPIPASADYPTPAKRPMWSVLE